MYHKHIGGGYTHTYNPNDNTQEKKFFAFLRFFAILFPILLFPVLIDYHWFGEVKIETVLKSDYIYAHRYDISTTNYNHIPVRLINSSRLKEGEEIHIYTTGLYKIPIKGEFKNQLHMGREWMPKFTNAKTIHRYSEVFTWLFILSIVFLMMKHRLLKFFMGFFNVLIGSITLFILLVDYL